MPSATEYEFDIFFSYKRDQLMLRWNREVHNRLKYLVAQTGLVKHEVKTFIDEEGIETGDHWPEKLQSAIRVSKCMVCLWSPLYFQSSWCISEWRTFLERERRLKTPARLIAPLTIHDGDHFPVEARSVQWIDVSPYASTVPAFWGSQRAIKLEDVLKKFADSVAKIIRDAPPFETDWPLMDASGMTRTTVDLARL